MSGEAGLIIIVLLLIIIALPQCWKTGSSCRGLPHPGFQPLWTIMATFQAPLLGSFHHLQIQALSSGLGCILPLTVRIKTVTFQVILVTFLDHEVTIKDLPVNTLLPFSMNSYLVLELQGSMVRLEGEGVLMGPIEGVLMVLTEEVLMGPTEEVLMGLTEGVLTDLTEGVLMDPTEVVLKVPAEGDSNLPIEEVLIAIIEVVSTDPIEGHLMDPVEVVLMVHREGPLKGRSGAVLTDPKEGPSMAQVEAGSMGTGGGLLTEEGLMVQGAHLGEN